MCHRTRFLSKPAHSRSRDLLIMLSSAFTPEAAIKVSSTYISAAELKGSKAKKL